VAVALLFPVTRSLLANSVAVDVIAPSAVPCSRIASWSGVGAGAEIRGAGRLTMVQVMFDVVPGTGVRHLTASVPRFCVMETKVAFCGSATTNEALVDASLGPALRSPALTTKSFPNGTLAADDSDVTPSHCGIAYSVPPSETAFSMFVNVIDDVWPSDTPLASPGSVIKS
jgi:hypothetical protein